MIEHNLVSKYFHGCKECRQCCDGKLYSMGIVTFSDFKKVIRLFPTVFDKSKKQFLFFYSLVPRLGCHYFRNNECSLYGMVDRPNTCLNYPFGIGDDLKIQGDFHKCENLNDIENDFPILLDNGEINHRVMNEFFTEFQYISAIKQNDKTFNEFVDLVFDSDALIPFPIFKTTDGTSVDIKEFDMNKNFTILDTVKIAKLIKKMDNPSFDVYIHGHLLSLENLPQFGKRLLQQVYEDKP